MREKLRINNKIISGLREKVKETQNKKKGKTKEAPALEIPGDIETGFNIDIDSEKIEVEKEAEIEIKKLSPEDKEKIGWGLSTIGFKVEKAKNDFFANAFDKPLSKIDKKGTVGRFFTELRDSFVRDSETALKKAKDTTSGKEKHRLSNVGLLVGNVLKYGRIVADFTGASIANPFRYVMMGGMVTARFGEAGKEARLKNEEVIEKTRIQDADLAAKEAWKIYENTRTKEKGENISVEALKNAYMMEMPKDLLERLKNPSTANSFIQKNLRKRLEVDIKHINDSLEKIYSNPKLSSLEKEEQEKKFILKQKGNLEDYDRMLTQYGTIDELAMAGRYAQTVGKGIVLGMQIETALVSAEKLFETVSNIYHHFHDVHTVLTTHALSQATLKPAPRVPITPTESSGQTNPSSAIKNFTNEGIKFEHEKGGIQGILDLKKQILTQYNGDYSKAPKSVQDFMDTDAAKEAIKLGLFDPSNPDGKESALIMSGSVLKFDEQGNLLFGKPDASGNVPILEKYQGGMFDSDHSAGRNVGVAQETTAPKHISEIEKAESAPKAESVSEPNPVDKARENVTRAFDDSKTEKTNILDTNPVEKTMEKTETSIPQNAPVDEPPRPGTVHTGTTYSTGSKVGVGLETHVGNEIHMGSEINTGSEAFTGGSYGNQPLIFGGERYYPDSDGQYYNALDGRQYFPEISPGDNFILQNNPEFADNPFDLSGEKLIEVHKAYYENANYLFREELFSSKGSGWLVALDSQKASVAIEHTMATDGETPAGKLGSYLKMLKNFTGLEPKSGFIGIGAETNKHYIVRALQKLTEEEKLGVFQASLRK